MAGRTPASTSISVDLPAPFGPAITVISPGPTIHVLAPETGELVDAFDVIEPWTGPAAGQDAHPAIVVAGGIAYVTEPVSNGIHAVDLATGEVLASATLPVTPNEIAVAAC